MAADGDARDDSTAAQRTESLCREIADRAAEWGFRVGTAESLTGGNIAAALSKAPSSGTWFTGAIVAYTKGVKQELLGVPEGPVVCQAAAETMARTAANLLDATITVAVTGEAGPDAQDVPPGTVWFAVYDDGAVTSECARFAGDPEAVVHATVRHAIGLLCRHADRS